MTQPSDEPTIAESVDLDDWDVEELAELIELDDQRIDPLDCLIDHTEDVYEIERRELNDEFDGRYAYLDERNE